MAFEDTTGSAGVKFFSNLLDAISDYKNKYIQSAEQRIIS